MLFRFILVGLLALSQVAATTFLPLTGAGKNQQYYAASFNCGSPEWLTRGAGFTGAADSKQLTISVWLAKRTVDSVNYRILTSDNSVAFLQFYIGAGNKLTLTVPGTGGTNVISVTATTDYLASDGWVHTLISFDLSNSSNRFYYRDDVAQSPTWGTYTDAVMDFTLSDWGVCALVGGSQSRSMDIADLQIWFGQYLDLSIEANRRLFIDANGKPVDPATAIAVLGTPTLQLTDPAPASYINLGSGGGMTINSGPLFAGTDSPSD